jgi:hypothetical protein
MSDVIDSEGTVLGNLNVNIIDDAGLNDDTGGINGWSTNCNCK